jgi:hypothetical protein
MASSTPLAERTSATAWSARGIFIDTNGRYLGELVSGNRLLRQRDSPWRSVNFGNYGNYGNVGNHGNPGNHGNIGIPGGYEDVPTPWL